MNPLYQLLRRLLLALGLSGWALAAAAAAIEVAPVSHELAPGKTALSMTISNRGDGDVTVQVRGFVWTQADGQDQLLPASDVVVAPAIFSLAPGRQQVLRALVPPAPAGQERSYRLLIDELPSADAAGQVRMALRLSVPVFVHGAAAAPSRLAGRLDAAQGRITVSNAGGVRARIHDLALVTASGERIGAAPQAGPYVLGGAQRTWSVAPSRPLAAGAPMALTAFTDAGRIEVPLVATP